MHGAAPSVPASDPSRASRYLLRTLTAHQVRKRFSGSTAGFLWSLAQPLFLLLIYTFVFSHILDIRFGDRTGYASYAFYLFCGMVPFQAMQAGLDEAAESLVGHSDLLKRHRFPAFVLPLQVVLGGVVFEALELVVLVGVAASVGYGVSWHLLLLPAAVLLRTLFTAGLAFILAPLQVVFRDTRPALAVLLWAWMFATPIIYPAALVPDRFLPLLVFNPAAHFVGIYRELLLNHRLPHPMSWVILTGSCLVVLGAAWLVWRRLRPRLVDDL